MELVFEAWGNQFTKPTECIVDIKMYVTSNFLLLNSTTSTTTIVCQVFVISQELGCVI